MRIVNNDNSTCFDCDGTLVLWDYPDEVKQHALEFDNYGFSAYLVPHYRMIEILKVEKTKGKYITVWTQNGYKWAQEIIERLNLTEYVDEVRCKPQNIFDDLPSNEFLTRVFLEPDFQSHYYKKAE